MFTVNCQRHLSTMYNHLVAGAAFYYEEMWWKCNKITHKPIIIVIIIMEFHFFMLNWCKIVGKFLFSGFVVIEKWLTGKKSQLVALFKQFLSLNTSKGNIFVEISETNANFTNFIAQSPSKYLETLKNLLKFEKIQKFHSKFGVNTPNSSGMTAKRNHQTIDSTSGGETTKSQ